MKMQEIEKELLDHPKFKDVCLAESPLDTSCSKDKSFMSPLSVFKMAGIPDLEAATQEEIIEKFTAFMNNKRGWALGSMFFDKYVSPTNVTVNYMRVMFPLGYPLVGYDNKTDRKAE